jgi:hypothetical protein
MFGRAFEFRLPRAAGRPRGTSQRGHFSKDTDVFVDNAEKFGTCCTKNPTVSIVNAAEAILGK